jgi:hypothetical protein
MSSQNEDKNSALEIPAIVLLQNTSNASFNACKNLLIRQKTLFAENFNLR